MLAVRQLLEWGLRKVPSCGALPSVELSPGN